MPNYLPNPSKNAALRALGQKHIFRLEAILFVTCFYRGHAAYQNFLLEDLRKYYTDLDSLAHSTWNIIDRFWNLDLSFTDEWLKDRYSKYGSKLRTNGAKADPIEKVTVAGLLPQLENSVFHIREQPYGSLFQGLLLSWIQLIYACCI